MKVDSLVRRSDQLRPKARWRTTDVLANIDEVSNWWRYDRRPKLTFGEAISSSEVFILDFQQVEVLTYIKSVVFPFRKMNLSY